MENSVKLKEKELPIQGSYDVVVAGGGTAGCFAAISALLEGLSVLIIEQSGGLGGMQCAGLVTPTMPTNIKDYPIMQLYETSQIRRELLAKLRQYDDVSNNRSLFEFNPIRMQTALEEVVSEHDGKILFHTTLVDAVVTDQKIDYVIVYNKAGLSAIKAKTFIDCTGDADLCVIAGVPTESGNSEGINQNISLRFEMAQVDIPVYEAFMNKICSSEGGRDAFMRKKYEEGRIREADIYHFQTFHIPGKPNCLAFNCPELGRAKNVIDPEYMSRQQLEGKQAVLKLSRFVIDCIPGFEHAFVTQISPILGIRDSRRIKAEYILTKDDVFTYRKFRDGIAVSNYPLDAHGEKNYGAGQGRYSESVPADERYYEIPFRSLIPVGIDNLLCAGRCAGTDFFTQSTTRIQHSCQYMGEAAGAACKFAIDSERPFRELDGKLVRAIMASRGDILLAKNIE